MKKALIKIAFICCLAMQLILYLSEIVLLMYHCCCVVKFVVFCVVFRVVLQYSYGVLV